MKEPQGLDANFLGLPAATALSGPAVAQAPPQALPGRLQLVAGDPWGMRLCTHLLAPRGLAQRAWDSGALGLAPRGLGTESLVTQEPWAWHPEAWA